MIIRLCLENRLETTKRCSWHVLAMSIRTTGKQEKFQRSWNVLSHNTVPFPRYSCLECYRWKRYFANWGQTYKHVLHSFPVYNLPLLAAPECLPWEIVKYHRRQAILSYALTLYNTFFVRLDLLGTLSLWRMFNSILTFYIIWNEFSSF